MHAPEILTEIPDSDKLNETGYELARRVAVYLAAGATALALSVAHPEVEPVAASVIPRPSADVSSKKKCHSYRQIKLKLVQADENPATQGPDFKMVARTCNRTTPKKLKNIQLVENGEHGQKKEWSFKKFKAGTRRERKFSLPARDSSKSPDPYEDGVYSLTLKAVSKNGKRYGKSKWNLRYGPEGRISVERQPKSYCRPREDFEVGIQDDNQFVYQKDISRSQAFDASSVIYGVKTTVLRMNVIYGLVMENGQPKPGAMQPYIDTIEEATRRGMKIHLTIMQTPEYWPKMDQGFGFEKLDAVQAGIFGKYVAKVLGSKVNQYTVGNEPNHPDFSATRDMLVWGKAYLAGRQGILESDPGANVLAGETAGASPDLMEYLNSLPNEGITIHPYKHVINEIGEYVDQSKTTLYLSEYGNFASDPDQAALNEAAVRKARCGGAKELIFYQLESDPREEWDTGIVNLSKP